ncbi:MAG: hypothetical protein QOE90_2691 [Thermoplasmata archaeon]|jgi:low affinity Fe/Cu permease|nr:hypothetical protein [Thermoplasmata archaeon]
MGQHASRRDRRRATRALEERHDAILAAAVRQEPHGPQRVQRWFGTAANRATQTAGSVWAFATAILVVLVWATTGPIFGYSDTWQLVINTGTTIVTFLMVFLIQHTQNRDTKAVHIKLNELIAAMEGASNRLIDVEDLDEAELDRLQKRFQEIADALRKAHGETRRDEEEAALGEAARRLDEGRHP